MKAVVVALVCTVLVVGETSAQMTQTLRDKVVSEHNRLRRDAIGPGGPDEVSTTTATAMLEMEYDMQLECVAQAYIETQSGGFQHNPNRTSDYLACGGSGYVGENWYSGSPDPDTDFIGGASRAWVDFIWPVAWGYNDCSERENYHGDRDCSGTVGHYTQVLWANSFKVGCGYTSTAGTVCNYSPGGNYTGQEPFIVGAACSACPGTHPYCNNGLCSKIDTSICSAAEIADGTCTQFTNNEMRNISTRADVNTDNDIAIAGFIISGDTRKCVVVRGRGPSVNVPDGVTRLPDPVLTLKSGQTTIAENDNWTAQTTPGDVEIITNLGIAPDDLMDAAIYKCLDPGAYTALLKGYLNTTGVGIIEVYDADEGMPYLRNISTRARVGTVHLVTIAGLIITGNTPKQILIRGRGPSVGVPDGVPRLPDPTLTLKSGQTTIGTNDNWQEAANAAEISATGDAPGDPLDSAILMELQPGAYTAILRGANGGTGAGIVEVLDLTGRQ